MVLVLELINPMYLFVAGGVFMIILGCACYGCHDVLYSHAENAAGVIACDASDCDIPDIHEQHIIDKGDGLWSKKAWGMESDYGSTGRGSAAIVEIDEGTGTLGGTPPQDYPLSINDTPPQDYPLSINDTPPQDYPPPINDTQPQDYPPSPKNDTQPQDNPLPINDTQPEEKMSDESPAKVEIGVLGAAEMEAPTSEIGALCY